MSSVCVMHVITGLKVGGAERMLLRLLNHTRHRAIVVSLTDRGQLGEKIESLGVPVHCMGLSRNLSVLQGLAKLKSVMRQYRPAVVQSWLYAADFLCSFATASLNIPLWWNVRQSETHWVREQWHVGINQRINARLSSRWPDGIVYCADAARQTHHRIGYQGRIETVIPNGIDTQAFIPSDDRRNRLRKNWVSDVTQSTVILGIVGRYDPLKNHDRFLEVMARLRQQLGRDREVIALMVGRNIDNNNSDLMSKVMALGLGDHCHLLGERDDIGDLMNAMDLVLLTSNSEGWPNVLGEAMACGRICVSSDVGDVALVTAEAGFVVNPVTTMDFVAKCEQALNLDEASRIQLQQRARQRIVDHFSIERAVKQYDTLYDAYEDSENQNTLNRLGEGN